MFKTVTEIIQKFKISPNSDEHKYNDKTVINIFNGMIENYVKFDKYHYLIGLYYQYVDLNYEMAIKFYDSALECDTDNKTEIQFLIGLCYFQLEDNLESEFWMQQAEDRGNKKATQFLNKHFNSDKDDIYGFTKMFNCKDEIYSCLSIPNNYIPPPQTEM